MYGSLDKLLIASARPIGPAEQALLKQHPNVTWWSCASSLRDAWQSWPEDTQTRTRLHLWALPASATAEQWTHEEALRQLLGNTGQPYRTLHTNQLADVLTSTLNPWTLPPGQTKNAALDWKRWQQQGCEKCSDPVCEHRMFQDLIKQRANTAAP